MIEKDFTNHDEYVSYLRRNNIRVPSFDTDELFPRLSLRDWSHFHNYLTDVVQRVALPSSEETKPALASKSTIDFSEYDKELEQLELSQQELRDQLATAKDDLIRLEAVQAKFVSHGKDDTDAMMQRVIADIKKIKDEIKSLEKKVKK